MHGGEKVEDESIINLFFIRSEDAVKELNKKYGRYANSIAYNILGNPSDAEECVSEAMLNVWNSIPPNRPELLSAFFGKYTRFAALKMLRERSAQKRGGGNVAIAFEELSECIPSSDEAAAELEAKELESIINSFLKKLPKRDRQIFVCRYWYFDSISDISGQFGFSQSKVKSILFRTRNKLRCELEKEGVLFE